MHPKATPFDDEAKQTLTLVLDTLIPPSADGRMPGAGELGLIDAILEGSGDLAPILAQGVAALDALAHEMCAMPFAALGAPERTEVVTAFASQQPRVFPGLLVQTYATYYQNPRVLEALGLEPRPPFPEGHVLELGDLSLLEPVRGRSKLYREV